VVLRNVLKNAKIDGYIKTCRWRASLGSEVRKRPAASTPAKTLILFCQAASTASKNGVEFADYVRLLALCGAREQETIKLRWADVDFEHKLLTIGADADTKNREARRVDFNAELETHLKAMKTAVRRIQNGCFPVRNAASEDERAKTFRESLLLTRAVPGYVVRTAKIMFGNETPKACPHCQGTRLEAQGAGAARTTCKNLASTTAGTILSATP
jgi:integrase